MGTRRIDFSGAQSLRDVVDLTVVHPQMLENGWELCDEQGGSMDPLYGSWYLHELYTRAKPNYTGRVTVPILGDKQRQTNVNNDAAEIIRMFNSAFDACHDARPDYYPAALRVAIDAINAQVYNAVSHGVYGCGLATRQRPYDAAFQALFATLDEIETRLAHQRYLVGEWITEADWRLFTTLLRFDTVYYSHFKCNLRRIIDYPNLWTYTRDLFQQPEIAGTVHMEHIKRHYFVSYTNINPCQIVPLGPAVDFGGVHDRDRVDYL